MHNCQSLDTLETHPRYDRKEIVLPVKIISGFSGWRLKEKIVSAIGLTVGDTISCDINVKADTADTESMDMLNESLSKFSLYAEGINADWLESIVTHLNQTVEVKLRLGDFQTANHFYHISALTTYSTLPVLKL